jgi:hypothetical protein
VKLALSELDSSAIRRRNDKTCELAGKDSVDVHYPFAAPGTARQLGPCFIFCYFYRLSFLSFVIPTPNGGGIFLRITAGQIHSGESLHATAG